MSKMYDVVLIGSGPGGYVAAIRAAQLGMKTAVVEERELGGVCLNWGCIPTKALIKSAEVFELTKRAGQFGLKGSGMDFDFPAVIKRSRDAANRLSKGVGLLFKKNHIDVYRGRGRLAGGGSVSITAGDGRAAAEIGGKALLLATGARPGSIPGVGIDEERIISSSKAMILDRAPDTLVIIGAGAIGVEFAYFFSSFGTKVTLVEMLPSVLPLSDPEIGGMLKKNFQRRGIKVLTGTRVREVKKSGAGRVEIVVQPENEETGTVEAEYALVAVGVRANIEDLGLEEAGVATERGAVKVDQYFRTSLPEVYAVGDVTGPPQLAHAASAEGIFAMECLAGQRPKSFDKESIPACTYCRPEVASIGLTEEAAAGQGLKIKVGRFPFVANGRALASGEREGMVKVIYEAGKETLLGAHIIGPEATELVAVFTLAKRLGLTGKQITEAVYAHPTLSETIPEATHNALGKAIHL